MQWSLQPDAAWEIFSVFVLKVQFFLPWLQTLQLALIREHLSFSHCQHVDPALDQTGHLGNLRLDHLT